MGTPPQRRHKMCCSAGFLLAGWDTHLLFSLYTYIIYRTISVLLSKCRRARIVFRPPKAVNAFLCCFLNASMEVFELILDGLFTSLRPCTYHQAMACFLPRKQTRTSTPRNTHSRVSSYGKPKAYQNWSNDYQLYHVCVYLLGEIVHTQPGLSDLFTEGV